jgi:hypothetical protein
MQTQAYAPEKLARKSRWFLTDLCKRVSELNEEKRKTPRVQFCCPVEIPGFGGATRVTDISMGGLFIECDNTLRQRFERGQAIRLFVKLPTEDGLISAKVRVANVGERGIGSEFMELDRKSKEAIRHCFNVFKQHLPAAQGLASTPVSPL